MAHAVVQGSIQPEDPAEEATLGDVMNAQQAIADAVSADHWISYHAAVRRGVAVGLTDEQIEDAYQWRSRRDGTPSFDIPAPCVTRWTGRKSQLTFVRCALCDWNDRGPDHAHLGALAAQHRCGE